MFYYLFIQAVETEFVHYIKLGKTENFIKLGKRKEDIITGNYIPHGSK